MLGEGAVAQVFALKALGWGAKRISQETGVSRNTVRDWLRSGESRRYGGDEGRPGILTPPPPRYFLGHPIGDNPLRGAHEEEGRVPAVRGSRRRP